MTSIRAALWRELSIWQACNSCIVQTRGYTHTNKHRKEKIFTHTRHRTDWTRECVHDLTRRNGFGPHSDHQKVISQTTQIKHICLVWNSANNVGVRVVMSVHGYAPEAKEERRYPRRESYGPRLHKKINSQITTHLDKVCVRTKSRNGNNQYDSRRVNHRRYKHRNEIKDKSLLFKSITIHMKTTWNKGYQEDDAGGDNDGDAGGDNNDDTDSYLDARSRTLWRFDRTSPAAMHCWLSVWAEQSTQSANNNDSESIVWSRAGRWCGDSKIHNKMNLMVSRPIKISTKDSFKRQSWDNHLQTKK